METHVELDPKHPLYRIALLSYDAGTGDVEVTLIDGSVARDNIGPQRTLGSIAQTTFDTRRSVLDMRTTAGEHFVIEIGRANERTERPVVYLDQNHWIDLARTLTKPDGMPVVKRDACERLIELARSGRVILPLSAGHLVEIAKKGGRQRVDVAKTMLELSRGWQMRSPLRIRFHELATLFHDASDRGVQADLDVFTLTPDAIWTDYRYSPPPRHANQDLPGEIEGLLERITWIASIADVLLEPVAEVSARGLAVAESWAASFHELAKHMRCNPKAGLYARDLTRTRFITDMGEDLPRVASASGISADEFGTWLRDRAEEALSSLPALGRVREVLHLRLVNADDKWDRNDLNDLLYLCSAAGYADVVIGEKKTCSYLNRVASFVSAGAQIFHRMVDAIAAVEVIAT